MKIVLDLRWSGKSGIGSFIDGILPYLLESENQFLLLGINEIPEKYKSFTNIKTVSCNIKPFSLKELFSFPKGILQEINSKDIYFTPYCNVPGGIKIPVYCTIHDVVFLDIPGLAGKTGTFIRKIFYKYAAFKSKGIFTVSNFSKERIIFHLHTKKEIYVVYSSVPEHYLSTEKFEKKNQIIFIGNIKKHKGLHILIPAFIDFRKKLAEENKELPELLIVGSKDNFRTKDTSLSMLESESEKNGIKFTGFISNEELKKELSQSKLLVQPSLYEGFGLPPLEAMYSGTKALISDIPVFKEIYKDFPVVYFKSEDKHDLLKKLRETWASSLELPDFPKIYSFKNTAEKILAVICRKQ